MVNVTITEEQVKDLCELFGKDPETIEAYEVGEMVDQAIDRFLTNN